MADLKNLFNTPFYIGLASRPDRKQKLFEKWNLVKNSLKKHGFVCDNNLLHTLSVDGRLTGKPSWFMPPEGAWGCYMSHLRLLENSILEDLPFYFVVEDDIEACPQNDYDLFAENCRKAVDALPDDWDMFYLGGQYWGNGKPVLVNECIARAPNVNRTHAYAVNGKAFKKLYAWLTNFKEWTDGHHIDHHLGLLHEMAFNTSPHYLNVYTAVPWLFTQGEDGGSDISKRKRLAAVNWDSNLLRTQQVGPGITVLSYKTGYGNIGLDKQLGYEGKKINGPFTGNGYYLSLHAPSEAVVKTDKKLILIGGTDKFCNPRQNVFLVDGVARAVLNKPAELTPTIELPAGTHRLEIYNNNRSQAHTYWIFAEKVVEPLAVTLPKFDLITNAFCPRKCPGCNQHHFMTENPEYSYGLENAKKLVKSLKNYGKIDLCLSGGEPAFWKDLEEVVDYFRESGVIGKIQIATSQYDQKNISRFKDHSDRLCISVRSEISDWITGNKWSALAPDYIRDCRIWDQREHVTGPGKKLVTEIDCCCMSQGIVAAIIGDEVFPCVVAKDMRIQGKSNIDPVQVEEYFSGVKIIPAIGSYVMCRNCTNNLKYRQTGEREKT